MQIKHTRQQWPVGHGFFHSASVEYGDDLTDPASTNVFFYVYDCGTRKGTQADQQVERYYEHRCKSHKPRTLDFRPVIDALVVSHTHADHISGIPKLLQLFDVRKIILPYLSEDEKLFYIAGMARSQNTGVLAALGGIVTAPQAWAESLSPQNGIQVVEVQASDHLGDDNQQDPSGDFANDIFIDRTPPLTDKQVHRIGIDKDYAWTFKFYNLKNDAVETDVLKGFAAALGCEENEVMAKLADPATLRLKFDVIKKASNKHKLNKNPVSLCMYSGRESTSPRWQYPFGYKKGDVKAIVELLKWERPYVGWLGTGDAELQVDVVRNAFFLKYRAQLAMLDTFCVPHHGSKGNWDPELVLDTRLDNCNIYLITGPTQNPPTDSHHPARGVLLDIRSKWKKPIIVGSEVNSRHDFNIKNY